MLLPWHKRTCCICPFMHAIQLYFFQAAEGLAQTVKQGGSQSIAIAGSKGVGKSTLARLLVNTLLNISPTVAFLDTDCGQPELTVPGLRLLSCLGCRQLCTADSCLEGLPSKHLVLALLCRSDYRTCSR